MSMITTLLQKEGISITPSAITLLDTMIERLEVIKPEELVSGIKERHPSIKCIETKLAVEILASYSDYKEIVSALKLPQYLEKTLSILQRIGTASPGMVAIRTKRSTSTERIYLIQLEKKGLVEKIKKGKDKGKFKI